MKLSLSCPENDSDNKPLEGIDIFFTITFFFLFLWLVPLRKLTLAPLYYITIFSYSLQVCLVLPPSLHSVWTFPPRTCMPLVKSVMPIPRWSNLTFFQPALGHGIYTDLWPLWSLANWLSGAVSSSYPNHCHPHYWAMWQSTAIKLLCHFFLFYMWVEWLIGYHLLLVHSLTGILSQLQVSIMLIFIHVRDLFVVVWVHPLLHYCFRCLAFSHCQNHFPLLFPHNAAESIWSSMQVQKGRIDPNILKTKGTHTVQLLENTSPVAWMIFALDSTHWANLSTRSIPSCRLGGT